MKIAHIFNSVERDGNNTKEFINPQEFKIDFINNQNKLFYAPSSNLQDDFPKKHYHSLVPIEDKSSISRYDDEKINSLIENLGDDLLLINGDFWGIQDFIFDGITSKKASKILRSRSAMVQLISFAIIQIVKKEFKESDYLLFGAGKFLILANQEDDFQTKIESIQKKLDSYFLNNFFGQVGFILSASTTTTDSIKNQNMRDSLLNLANRGELNKLNKFNFRNLEDKDICIDIFANSDDRVCEFCSKRAKTDEIYDEECCDICFNQINLGKKLTNSRYVNIIMFGKKSKEKKISHNLIEILKFNNISYYARFSDSPKHFSWGETFDISDESYDQKIPKWSLNSYVAKNSNGEIKTFDEYIKKDDKTFSSGLMALKADIDKLGDTFREFYQSDLRKYNRLSREVDFFFSDYITSLIKKYENIYTVFAGGDDLFLIGEYREIMRLAKEIRAEFYKFSLKKVTISMGLVMFKPSTPINYISHLADEAEKRAKVERDSIDIFGISMKYDEFMEIEESFDKVIDFLKDNKVETTTFYYRLIELCDMRENINENIKNAMWKSKLNYLFRRNIERESNNTEIFDKLKNLIDRGEKFKPSLFFKIYENRDEKLKESL